MSPITRRCLLEPIPQIFEAAQFLTSAVADHLAGRSDQASANFAKAEMSSVRDWTEAIWGKHRPEVLCIRSVPNSPPTLPKEARVKLRMPTAKEQASLIEKHGYKCAFCGIPLIHKRVRSRAVRLYPESVSWGRTNQTQHAAFQAMWLQFDHVLPHARGGDNSIDNLLITCAPCNFGRMNYTLEELGLSDPRDRAIDKGAWDGLESFI
jgi:hypothetical protein